MRFVSSMSGVFKVRPPAKSGATANAAEAAMNSFRVVVILLISLGLKPCFSEQTRP
jgi:hypothetical protein